MYKNYGELQAKIVLRSAFYVLRRKKAELSLVLTQNINGKHHDIVN